MIVSFLIEERTGKDGGLVPIAGAITIAFTAGTKVLGRDWCPDCPLDCSRHAHGWNTVRQPVLFEFREAATYENRHSTA